MYLKQHDVTLPFFSKEGERLLWRDPLHNAGRGGKGNHKRYLKKIKARGVLTKLRGVPICRAEEGKPDARKVFVAGATLVESCYMGFETAAGIP